MDALYISRLLHIDLGELSRINDPKEYWRTFMQMVEYRLQNFIEDTSDESDSESDYDVDTDTNEPEATD